MLQKLLCLLLLFKSSHARYGFVPKFYGQDSAVIVDTDKPLPQTNHIPLNNYSNKLRLPPPFPLWQHFPRYHVIPPPPNGQIFAINTWPKSNVKPTVTITPSTSTTRYTTTTTPTITTTTLRTSIPTTTSTTFKSTTSATTSIPNTSETTSKPTTTSTTNPPPTTTIPISKSEYSIDTVPFVTDTDYPKELLDIAHNKLGLERLYEIPTISELGQLLGTNSPQETLEYIKKLTSNDQGVALMKAYIESTDYTDTTGDLDNNNQDDVDDYTDDGNVDNIDDTDEPLTINDEGLVVIDEEDPIDNDYETDEDLKTTTTIQPRKSSKTISKLKALSANKPGFFERIANYMHINNLWHKTEQKIIQENDEIKNQKEDTNTEQNDVNRVIFIGKTVIVTSTELPQIESIEDVDADLPIFVRDPIPYNYPVPLRPKTSTTTTTTSTPSTIDTTVIDSSLSSPSPVHLNTPKILMPHVQQLARAAKISPQKIEDFLATKPKLLALANKVSRFPIGYDRNSPMEAQVMMAVKRAIDQDDDLKKLLNSTATLK